MSQNSAQAIAKGLAGAGCRHVFGMPGGEVLVLLDALEQAGVEFTLCKNETSAGYMAEGSWQATGAPGILLTTIGPGLANGVNSIANAYLEQVPLIILSGCIAPAAASQFTHQVIDQAALLRPITKATFQVGDGDAEIIVQKALALAMADPPGPVHIDLPDSLADKPVPETETPAPVTERAGLLPGTTLEQALNHLKNAKRPIILAGIGAVLHGAGKDILELSEAHEIPVVTSYKAKGIVPEDHPNALGGHGLSPLSDKTILPLLAASDCVLCFGYDPVEMRSDWIRPWKAENALEFVHAQVEHGMHGSALRHVGDVAAAVRAISSGLGSYSGKWPDNAPSAAKSELESQFGFENPACKEWGPHAVFSTLNRHLPKETVITVDSGAHRILMSQMFQANRPGHLLQSAAFCTMGVAVPLAIGYKRAAPDTPVVAVVGDAGLDMAPGDLSTLRDMGMPLTIIVLVDDTLTLIERKQKGMQLGKLGVTFGSTDFPVLARAYGGFGESIEKTSDFRRALSEASDRTEFTILACKVEKEGYTGAF